MNLLDHEMRIAVLLSCCYIPVYLKILRLNSLSVKILDCNSICCHSHDSILRYDEIALRVFDKCCEVRCDKCSVIAICCNHRAYISDSKNLSRLILEHDTERK